MYHCQVCGAGDDVARFARCRDCGAWGSAVSNQPPGEAGPPRIAAGKSTRLIDLKSDLQYHPTHLDVIDQALGGGLAWGYTAYLLGGQGAGKTTLALRVADALREPVLFVSSEESLAKMADKRHRDRITSPAIQFLYEADVREIVAEAERVRPVLLIVNSLTTTMDPAVKGAAGSSRQLKHCLKVLMAWTAAHPAMTLVTGQLTWKGHSAGPRGIEHDADVVLYIAIDGGERVLQVRKSRISASPASYLVPNFSSEGSADDSDASLL